MVIFKLIHFAVQYMRKKKNFKKPLLYATHVSGKLFDYITQKTFRIVSKTLYCSLLKKTVSLIENKDSYRCGNCMKKYKLVREASKLKKSILLKSRKFYKRQPSSLAVRKRHQQSAVSH